MHLKELKEKSPAQLLEEAEALGIEDASSMRKQDLMFSILKKVASDDNIIYGDGTIEVMQDGFGFLRSAQSNYLAGPDDIYVYFDVPIVIFRKMVAAPSAGHAFWQYIRGKYSYAKLTGDKKTKMKGGVSS